VTYNQPRAYSSPAFPTALTAPITSTTAPSMQIGVNPTSAALNWPANPNGTTAPYYTLLLDWGSTIQQGQAGAAEVVLVTGVSGSGPYTLTILRGQDGTQPATHAVPSAGSNNVYHGVSEQDFGDSAAHLGAPGPSSTNPVTGNAISVHGLTAANSVVVGTNDTQTLTNKNLTSGTNTFPTFNQNTTGSSGSCTGNAATATAAAGLETTGSAVGVSSAAPPSAGQALVATSATAASWQQALSGVYDVTKYGVTMTIGTTPPSSAVQTANVNALIALCGSSGTAPAGSIIYFPPGVCYLNAVIGTLGQSYAFIGSYGQTSIAMTVATSGTWITTTTSGASPTSFEGLMFYSSGVSQTTGAVIEFGTSLQPIVRNCQFNGGGGTYHLFNCLSFNGGTASNVYGGANGAVIDSCNFGAFAGTAITVTSCIGSHCISNCLITGGYSGGGNAVAGITETTNCDIIACTNNMLITSVTGGTVASVFMNQCFMDQAVGSNLLITGAGTVARCRFVGCWFTLSASSSGQSAVVVNTSGTSTHAGLEWNNCWVLNTPTAGGTANGFLLSAVSDFTIDGCEIAGWNGSGISVTPVATSGVTKPTIINNVITAVGIVGTNTIGITLASSTNYGSIQVTNNNLASTTPLVDSSTVVSGSQKYIANNTGLPVSGNTLTPSTTGTVLTASLTTYGTIVIPANSLRAGQVFRCRAQGIQLADAVVYSCQVTIGTVPTNVFATAPVVTAAATAGMFDIEVLVYIVSAASDTTVEALGMAKMRTSTGLSNSVAPAATSATIANASATTLNFQIDATTDAADATLWGPVVMEVLQQ
jgi:hypothetical protein